MARAMEWEYGSSKVQAHHSEATMDDDKKEGLITTAQDAVVDTAKAGWEGVKAGVETVTSAVTEALPGRKTKRSTRTGRKAQSPSAVRATKKKRTGSKPARRTKAASGRGTKRTTSTGRKATRAKSTSTGRSTGAAKRKTSGKGTSRKATKPSRAVSSRSRRSGSRSSRSSR